MTDFSDVDVGIDDFSVYIPKLFLPLKKEFSDSRNIDPQKLIHGIGIESIAIPDKHEDAATMAAMSLLELLKRSNIDPDKIGKIYIGTESGVDEAKAIGNYVIGMLEKVYGKGSFKHCLTVEYKSACIATTMALESMNYWLAMEDNDQIGIVIASDIAKYPLHSPGEYTQGAGSVSLLMKRNPRLIRLEQAFGTFVRDENDFYRPLGSSTAVVNGKHSNRCYLEAMQEAFISFSKKALEKGIIVPGSGQCYSDFINHMLFHIPYPRMVEYASLAIFRQEWRKLPRWKEIEDEIGPEPKTYDEIGKECLIRYDADDAQFLKKFSMSKAFLEAFNSKAKDSSQISRRVGNIYTGSIFLGLASLIEKGKVSHGERLGFGAYGSGCSALFFCGIAQREMHSVPLRCIKENLDSRYEITLKSYESLHNGEAKESIINPLNEFALIKIDHQGYRHYDYIQ